MCHSKSHESVSCASQRKPNSPRKLFANYREIVTEQDAQDWFAVAPGATPPAKKRKEREKQASAARKKIIPIRKTAA